jgi:hypothetical protein
VHERLSGIDPQDYTDGVHSVEQSAVLADAFLYHVLAVEKLNEAL